MSRKYHTLRLGDDQYRLRLTIRGQNNLRERFQEDTIQTVLGAATDSRRMVALLEEALNWEGNENPVTDGERFYDLLVDQGYCGQIQFSGLAFDIAACSGLVTAEQAKTLKESVAKAVTDAYADIREGKEAEEVPEEERPFQQKQGGLPRRWQRGPGGAACLR